VFLFSLHSQLECWVFTYFPLYYWPTVLLFDWTVHRIDILTQLSVFIVFLNIYVVKRLAYIYIHTHTHTVFLSPRSLMGLGGQRHAPAALPPGMTRYPLYSRLGGPQGRSGRVRKISPPKWIRFPDRSAVPCRYTDHAISTPFTWRSGFNSAPRPVSCLRYFSAQIIPPVCRLE
jgi:hypothetical protein